MNFKLTLWKSIIIIVVALVIPILVHNLIFPCEAGVYIDEEGVESIADPVCAFKPVIFLPTYWILSVALIILIYIIWSLIQKKR